MSLTASVLKADIKVSKIKPFGALVQPASSDTRAGDLDIDLLRDLFRENQLIVLRGFQTFQTADEFSDYCEQWGEVSLWPFGKVLELIQQEKPDDHIFDHSYM